MSFRINSNAASLSAQRALSTNQRQMERSLSSLALGSRIVRAGDDAAGFAIAESLRGQLSGLKQAKMNAEGAVSLVQTAEGALNEQNNILIRLRELAVYAASDTVGKAERGFLDAEFQQLSEEFDRIAKTTRFGHSQLLTGSGNRLEFHVGANADKNNWVQIKLDADTTARNVGIHRLEVTSKREARRALSDLDDALLKVSQTRAELGAFQSRFHYATDHLAVQAENIEMARSRIVDVDVAEAVTEVSRARILQDAGTAVLAQANSDSMRVLRLIG